MDETQFTPAERKRLHKPTSFEFTADQDGMVTIESAVTQALDAVRKEENANLDNVAQALIDYLHGIDYLHLPTWEAER
jgi:hypothetical protein